VDVGVLYVPTNLDPIKTPSNGQFGARKSHLFHPITGTVFSKMRWDRTVFERSLARTPQSSLWNIKNNSSQQRRHLFLLFTDDSYFFSFSMSKNKMRKTYKGKCLCLNTGEKVRDVWIILFVRFRKNVEVALVIAFAIFSLILVSCSSYLRCFSSYDSRLREEFETPSGRPKNPQSKAQCGNTSVCTLARKASG